LDSSSTLLGSIRIQDTRGINKVPIAFVLHEETGTVWTIPTGKKRVYIGKPNPKTEIDFDLSQLPDSDIISRVHAVIHIEEDEFYLEDMGSLNGTSVNGEALKSGRKRLRGGEMITFGHYRPVNLFFEIESPEDRPLNFQSLALE
jgi:uncharacterized Zn finger protein